jgi:phosphatidylglycerophosphatase A
MPLCFLSTGANSIWMFVLGFLIFRIFDICKPIGISLIERVKGGFGIVLDDVAAACCTNVTLHVIFLVWRRCV